MLMISKQKIFKQPKISIRLLKHLLQDGLELNKKQLPEMVGLEIMIIELCGNYMLCVHLMLDINVFISISLFYSVPNIPFLTKKANSSPFYGPDDEIPILVTTLMGIQRKYTTPYKPKMYFFFLISIFRLLGCYWWYYCSYYYDFRSRFIFFKP